MLRGVAVLNLLAPIFVIIALGAVLQRGGMMPEAMIAGVNRLLYWVGLPAAVFHSLVNAEQVDGATGALVGVLLAGTVVSVLVSWGLSLLGGVEPANRGTFVQAAFRGNLSFVGLPLLLSVPGIPRAPAVLALAPALILYNAVSVFALLASRHETGGLRMWGPIGRQILRNPIILAAAVGAALHGAGWELPVALNATLGSLAHMSLPLALLCIGAALMTVPLRGNRRRTALASFHKVLLSPLIGYGLGRWAGLDGGSMLAVLLLMTCPTAAISYPMVKQMGGDEALAASAVVYSSIASAPVLAVVIAWFAV